MPDPIDELENFSIPGPTMTHLPAAEVRRRGNRIRRRNNALATVGALAVVAAIATPFAIAAGGGGEPDSQPPIAPQPPSGWTTTIPANFDLGALPDGTQFTFDVRDESVIDNLRLCGSPAFSTDGASDTAGAYWGETGSEGSADRTLAVYPDDTEADAALATLQKSVDECATDPNGTGAPLVIGVVSSSPDSLVFTQQAQDGDLLYDLTAFQAVVSGNALYVASAHTAAGGQQAMGTVDNLIANSAPVVDQLCIFSIDGCAPDEEPSEAVDEPTGLSGAIPDDFPLEKGLPTSQANGAVGLEGPSHHLDLAVYNVENTVQACGTAPTGLPEPVDTLYAGYRSPAEGILRQLMTFASVADAQAYVDNLMAPYADCPQETIQPGVTRVREVTPSDLGDQGASAVTRSEVDGEPGIGYQVVAVTRVGQAVLFTLVNNDGDPFDADRVASYVENTQAVVDEMN
jgi:hypothetical protein